MYQLNIKIIFAAILIFTAIATVFFSSDVIPLSVFHKTPVKKTPPKKPHLCMALHGGTGNVMFMVASVYSTARQLNMTPVFSQLHLLKSTFDLSIKFSEDFAKRCKNASSIKEQKACSYDSKMLKTIKILHTDFAVDGFLQSWFYFRSFFKEIRELFRFRPEIVYSANHKLKEKLIWKYGKKILKYVQSGSHKLVGLHVRRGDLLDEGYKEFGYVVAEKQYLHRAQKYFRDKLSNLTFVVCSNDFKWSRNAVQDNGDVIFMENNMVGVDLYILSQMNHTIFTVGTFGWWGSWLSNGSVVYFNDHVTPGSQLSRMYSTHRYDYFLPGWFGIT